MKKQSVLAFLLITISVTLAVISYFVLPEDVITQFSLNSTGTTTSPKLLAIALPFALGAGAATVSLFVRDNNRTKVRCFIISGLGIILFALMLFVNCFMK